MHEQPYIYCRYLDDIFVDIKDEESLQRLKRQLEHHSVLSFTTEMADGHKLAFLDVDINSSSGDFQTTVYRKLTNTGHCLNGRSECPDRYRLSVISAYIHRALKHSSTWQLAHQELQRVRQILADNSYSQTTIDAEIQHAITRFNQAAPAREGSTSETTYTLLYENQMSGAYKTDERILRGIIHRNCEPIRQDENLNSRSTTKALKSQVSS